MTPQSSQLDPIFWPNGERRDIWMIVDAARDHRIFPLLLDCHLNYSCLYSGTLPPALETAAPYLVQLDYDYRDTRRLLQQAWGNQWGIFLRSDTSLEKLRRHLRGFLVVRDPAGSRLVFRYYDPRILRVYLPTCNEEELATVFGPIDRFWTESTKPENLLDFRLLRGKLVQRTVSFLPSAREQTVDQDTPNPEISPNSQSTPRRGLFTIRATQMTAFAQREIQKFEDWMSGHLRQFFPEQCHTFSEPRLRELIGHGIKRAAVYQITAERDVCKFIDLMIVFGQDFDIDARHPWASRILGEGRGAATRMQKLFEVAGTHLGQQ